jgi:hypothetical protein
VLLDNICDFITASTSHGLTTSSSSGGNLYKVPFPEGAITPGAFVTEYAGVESVHSFGASRSAPLWETVRFQILVRDTEDQAQRWRNTIESVYRALDWCQNVTLSTSAGGSNTRYLSIVALGPPALLRYDDNSRPEFYCNFEARKERG